MAFIAEKTETQTDQDELLTTKEACKILKCGLTRLYQFMNAGNLKSVSMGKSRRIPRSAINKFISSLPDA